MCCYSTATQQERHPLPDGFSSAPLPTALRVDLVMSFNSTATHPPQSDRLLERFAPSPTAPYRWI